MSKHVNKRRRWAMSIILIVILWCSAVIVVTVPDEAGREMTMQPLFVLQIIAGGCAAAITVRQINRFDKERDRSHSVALNILMGLIFLASFLFASRTRLSEAGFS